MFLRIVVTANHTSFYATSGKCDLRRLNMVKSPTPIFENIKLFM